MAGQYTPLHVIAERYESGWRLFDKESGEVRWYPRAMTDNDRLKINEDLEHSSKRS